MLSSTCLEASSNADMSNEVSQLVRDRFRAAALIMGFSDDTTCFGLKRRAFSRAAVAGDSCWSCWFIVIQVVVARFRKFLWQQNDRSSDRQVHPGKRVDPTTERKGEEHSMMSLP